MVIGQRDRTKVTVPGPPHQSHTSSACRLSRLTQSGTSAQTDPSEAHSWSASVLGEGSDLLTRPARLASVERLIPAATFAGLAALQRLLLAAALPGWALCQRLYAAAALPGWAALSRLLLAATFSGLAAVQRLSTALAHSGSAQYHSKCALRLHGLQWVIRPSGLLRFIPKSLSGLVSPQRGHPR
jgi:hypothetical protein